MTLPARMRLVLATAVIAAVRATDRRVGLAVMHHRVAPRAGDPARELVPAVSTALLDQQLAYVRRHLRLVAAEELLAAAGARRRGKPVPVAVTFDDDTACHLEHAAPVLRRHGAPAVFFLNGRALHGPAPYWWEWLQAVLDAGVPLGDVLPADAAARLGPDPQPWEVSRAVEDLGPAAREELVARWRALAPAAPAPGLDAAAVRALAAQGFSIGFHGTRHEPLPLLGDDELAAELRDGRPAVEAAAGAPVTLLAYPHGRADARVAAAARSAGFSAAFTVEQEPVTPASNSMLLGRVDGAVGSLADFAWALARTLVSHRA